MLHLSAWAIGEFAATLLASGTPAYVMGITSRGAFLRLGQGVVFLSTEPYRGPLTVNLVGGLPHGLEVGALVDVKVEIMPALGPTPNPSLKGGELIPPSFREGGRGVGPHFGSGEGPTPWLGGCPSPNIPCRLTQMIQLVLAARPDGEASDLLRELLALSVLPPPPVESLHLPENRPRMPHETTNASQPETYSCIRGYIRGRDSSSMLPLLGRGEGLTPWGDDLIMGLLLARYYLQPEEAFRELADELTAAAFTKTSLLSANLIACAAGGQADERLLLALSALLYGDPSVESGAQALLGWGNTSGVAALAGMALAIHSLEGS